MAWKSLKPFSLPKHLKRLRKNPIVISGFSNFGSDESSDGFFTQSKMHSLVRMYQIFGKGWIRESTEVKAFRTRIQKILDALELHLESSKVNKAIPMDCLEKHFHHLPTWGIMLHGVVWDQGTLEDSCDGIESGLLPAIIESESHDGVRIAVHVRQDKGGRGRIANRICKWYIRHLRSGKIKEGKLSEESVKILLQQVVCLNPCFAEALMNWPVGWTDMKEAT